MFEANKAMLEMARDGIEKRNQLVIKKGDAAFKQAGPLAEKLEQAIRADHNQIKEEDFKIVFLPFFAKDENPEYPQVTIEHWIGAVGDTMKPTDVINSRGEVITMQDGTPLTIPAVFNRNALRTMTAGRDGNNAATGQILEEAKKYENMGESTVRQVMGKYLAHKANAAKVPGQTLANARHWNKIMAHYGRPPLYAIPGEQSAPQPGTPTTTSPAGDTPGPAGVDDLYYELP
jgi:hypothetical protein